MALLLFDFGITGLADLRYQFIDIAAALIAAPVTAGILEAPGARGCYMAAATVPAGAVAVYAWSLATTDAYSYEPITDGYAGITTPPAAAAIASATRTEIAPELLRVLTALPAAAPNANGGLPILSGAGTTLGYTLSTLGANAIAAGSIATGAITSAKFAAGAINATAIAAGAIVTATFAAGTTLPRCTLVDALGTDGLTALSVSTAAVTKMQAGLLLATGYTAPPSAGDIATQVNTTLTASHGTGSWQSGEAGGGGGLSGPSAVNLTFVDADGAPVPNVEFTVVDQGTARADTNGLATFGLPDGSYLIAAAITNRVTFPVSVLTVAGDTALEVEGSGLAIAPPAYPLPCRVEGFFAGPSAANAKVVFELLPGNAPAGGSGHLYAGRKWTATAVNGFISIDLFRGETYRLQSIELAFSVETITLEESLFDLASVLD